jgi:hypothetical protein
MGLDMYLKGKRYLFDKEVEEHSFDDVLKFTGGRKPKEITFMLGYWRKANAIHNWFVKNVQGGEDDCKEYLVPFSYLVKLRDACKEALDNNNPDILEPVSGFFFGSTDIDDWYWEDIKKTHELMAELCQDPDIACGNIDVYYQSSW